MDDRAWLRPDQLQTPGGKFQRLDIDFCRVRHKIIRNILAAGKQLSKKQITPIDVKSKLEKPFILGISKLTEVHKLLFPPSPKHSESIGNRTTKTSQLGKRMLEQPSSPKQGNNLKPGPALDLFTRTPSRNECILLGIELEREVIRMYRRLFCQNPFLQFLENSYQEQVPFNRFQTDLIITAEYKEQKLALDMTEKIFSLVVEVKCASKHIILAHRPMFTYPAIVDPKSLDFDANYLKEEGILLEDGVSLNTSHSWYRQCALYAMSRTENLVVVGELVVVLSEHLYRHTFIIDEETRSKLAELWDVTKKEVEKYTPPTPIEGELFEKGSLHSKLEDLHRENLALSAHLNPLKEAYKLQKAK